MVSKGRSLGDVVAWAVAWALAALVLVYSLGPVPPGAGAFPEADELVHAAGYALTVSAFLLAAVWRPRRGAGRFPRAAPWVVVTAVVAGGLIEIAQGLFFGRDSEAADVIADLVGSGLAWAAFAALRAGASRPVERELVDAER